LTVGCSSSFSSCPTFYAGGTSERNLWLVRRTRRSAAAVTARGSIHSNFSTEATDDVSLEDRRLDRSAERRGGRSLSRRIDSCSPNTVDSSGDGRVASPSVGHSLTTVAAD